MAKLARKPTPVRLNVSGGRPLTREDVTTLVTEKRSSAVSNIVRLRDSHHYVARLVSAGFTDLQIAERTGYSGNRIHQLRQAPAFQELVASYRNQITEGLIEQVDEYQKLAFGNMIAAERHIADAIAEADANEELIPIKTALAISRDAADRFGYGKKNTNINLNVDFAAQLEAAIRRSGKDSILELKPNPPGGQGSPVTGEGGTVASTLPPPSFRRI